NRLTIKSADDGQVVFDGGGTIDTGITIRGTCFVTVEGITFTRFTADASAAFGFGAAAVNVSSADLLGPSNDLILRSLTVTESTLDHPTGEHAEIAIWCEACVDNTIDSVVIDSVEPAAIVVGSPTDAAVEQRGTISNCTISHVRDDQTWVGIFGRHTNVWTVSGSYVEDVAASRNAFTDGIRVEDSSGWTFGS